jgi:flagellar M-ring protein FliF
MATGLTGIGEQTRAAWAQLTAGRRIAAVASVLLVLSLLGVVLFYSPSESYDVLFSRMAPQDAGEVLEKLKADKIPYQLEAEGATILVPAAKVYDLRLELAQLGLPKGTGVGFEVFDQQAMVTTSFVEQTNYQRALQGELARTISSLKAVESARVHLAMGNRSLFKEQDQPPSASVALQLKPGQELSKDQARAIVHLVSSSIDGLTPERVTVLDSRGKLLSAGLEDGQNMDEQREIESDKAKKIQSMLENVFGVGKVIAKVTADLDYRQVDSSEVLYPTSMSAVVSEATVMQGAAAQGTTGGLAGARGNLPGAPAPVPAAPAGNPGDMVSETRNFNNSSTTIRTIGPKMQIRKLHVAVLLDANALSGAGGSTSQSTSQPATLSKELLAQIEAIARQAAGVDLKRGDELEVQSIPFLAVRDPALDLLGKEEGALPWWAPWALGGGVLGVALLFFALRKKKNAKAVTTIQLLPAKLATLEKSLTAIEAERPSLALDAAPVISIREQVLELARNDAPKAARVLSLWLAEPMKEEKQEAVRKA